MICLKKKMLKDFDKIHAIRNEDEVIEKKDYKI